MTNDELISAAAGVLLPRVVNGRVFGNVGAAILSASDQLFLGVSIDTASWGSCAERCALATMIATGECAFKKAVAVWRDPATCLLHILPPWRSIDSEVILSRRRVLLLRDLLPEHAWPTPEQA